MKSAEIIINDDVWTFALLSRKEYNKKHGKDSEGLTDSEAKTVDMRQSKFTLQLLLHELWHVHCYYKFYERANLKAGQTEETSAELFAYRGEHMLQQGKEIYSVLKKLQNQRRKKK